MTDVYRFVFSRRWLGFFALCVLVALGCGLLSLWQWHRREARLAANALVVTNYDRPPATLAEALPGDGELPAERTWTPVQVAGRYIPSATTLVRNRPRDGVAGHLVLVPLLTEDGRVLVVDRGWVPLGSSGSVPEVIPAPPPGQVRVTARLRPPEAAGLQRTPPEGQTYRKRPADLAADLAARSGGRFSAGQVVAGTYGQLAAEDPAPEQPLPVLARPTLDEGPHLAYSMQWVAFGAMALIGFVVVVRRTAAHDDLDEPPPRRARARPTDEEVEDALLDAQRPAGDRS